MAPFLLPKVLGAGVNALAGEDAISVTAWLYLPTGASGPVFDFGQSASSRRSPR